MTAEFVRSARKALSMSQTDMADALGVGYRTIQRMEVEGCTRMGELAIRKLLDDAGVNP